MFMRENQEYQSKNVVKVLETRKSKRISKQRKEDKEAWSSEKRYNRIDPDNQKYEREGKIYAENI